MSKLFLLILLTSVCNDFIAQNKSGYAFIYGGPGCIYSQFVNSTSNPVSSTLYSSSSALYRYGASSICDSATGKIKITSNGMRVYDSIGNIMENGDDLQPYGIMHHNSVIYDIYNQGSLILPKGSNNQYYLFTNTITDSLYDSLIIGSHPKYPFNLLQYHVIDMNANSGLGKVVQKNVSVLQEVELDKSGMQACRHANGYDWWLIKQGTYDSSVFYKILVTADTVVVKDTQVFNDISFGVWDQFGQSCFSADGKKFAYTNGRRSQIFLADFNRCTGEFTNEKIIYIPIDSTTDPAYIQANVWDTLVSGIAFSANNKFIYLSREYNIYQYEVNNPDSATAWFRVKHGEDTTFQKFAYYGMLYRAVDGRIYIGKKGNNTSSNSVINKPNLKGAACEFCRFCLRYDVPNAHTLAPNNMPDFLLGLDSTSCWPLSQSENVKQSAHLTVYPNPSSTHLYFKNTKQKRKELYNYIGQLIHYTNNDELYVADLVRGFYFVKCGSEVVRVVVE
jgi:hypothetical protein